MKYLKLFFVLLSIGILISCEKENEELSSDFSIVGYAQKGQFIKGSTITAYALNDKLFATGESFPSSIKDDLGSFTVSAEVAAPYIELKAEGYYFVENTGETSTAPIYLNALVSSSQEKVNVNLLTSLTSERIKRLIHEGKSFDAAKKQAEKELISVFSFQQENVTLGFEEMNISEDGNSNAVLLAISCLIQEGRNAGEVQKVISDISSEFEANGSLSEKLLNEIFDEYRQVSVSDVVGNLIAYYDKNGIANFKIPPFYAMLDKEYSSGFHIISMGLNYVIPDGYDTDIQGGTKDYYAISYDDFVTESDVEWITAEVKELCTNLYTLKINISTNSEVSGRTGHLYVKSKSGEILYTNTTRQRGNGQRIYIEQDDVSPRTRSFEDGDVVNINGKDYKLLYDSYLSEYYVELPKLDNGYGISNMPEMVVAGKNGDVLCATFTYNSETEEYINNIDDGIEFTKTSESSLYDISIGEANGKTPCYAALKDMPGFDLPNPAKVSLKPSCSLLTLNFKNEDMSKITDVAKIEVEFGHDGFLAGEITTCMYPDQAMFDPSYVIPKDEYKNKSNKVLVHNTNKDDKVSFFVHPQTIQILKCTAYDMNGSQLFQVMRDVNIDFQKGCNTFLTIQISK